MQIRKIYRWLFDFPLDSNSFFFSYIMLFVQFFSFIFPSYRETSHKTFSLPFLRLRLYLTSALILAHDNQYLEEEPMIAHLGFKSNIFFFFQFLCLFKFEIRYLSGV